MKIKKICLRNFQCHEKLDIELSDGINCITSANNSGKSVVVRAVAWLETDRPRGDWMIKEGTKKTEVKIIYDDETVISRIKGSGGLNKYVFNGDEYNNSGCIPDAVKDFLGNGSLSLNNEQHLINLTLDDDPPFLLKESSTTRGALLNYLTGVDNIERVKKTVAVELREYSGKQKNRLDEIGKYTAELDTYDDLEEDSKRFDKVVKEFKQYKGIKNKIENLEQLITEIELVDAKISGIRKIEVKLVAFTKLHTQFIQCQEQNKALVEYVSVCNGLVAIGKIKPALNALNGQEDKYNKIDKELSKLVSAFEKIETREKEIEQMNETIKYLNEEMEEEKGKFVECPTCGTYVDKDKING